MKPNLFRTCAVVGVLAAFVACSDNSTVAPKTGVVPGQKPAYSETTPFNDNGACMANDMVAAPTGTVSGVSLGDDPTKSSNCTSNDVAIAQANLISYQVTDANGNFLPPVTFHPGDNVSCIAGSPIKLNLSANLDETATSARSDIGVWIATDGGNAITGACNHYNLTTNPLAAGASNPDGDHCADLAAGAVVDNFPLGVIDAVCQTASGSTTNLHVGSCLAWKEPGADGACPLPDADPTTAPNWLTESPTGYRFGTLPANKSKCNCAGFDVPITVLQKAKLEVVKACTPTTDPGTFDLLIDGSTTVNSVVVGDNIACGGSTGAQNLSAGTNVSPGAVHSFGEGDFTTANYTSSYSCVNRLTTGPQHVFTASGDATATGTSLGPNQITLQPNEDVVCTYTNVRKPQVKVVKALVPTTDAGTFDFTIDGLSQFTNSGAGYGNTGTTGFQNVSVGTVAISEAAHSGTTLSDYSSTLACVNASNQTVTVTSNTGTSGSVSAAAGDQITCTFTNTRKPKVKVVKSLNPTTDAGRFDLTLAGTTYNNGGAGFGDGGNTGFQFVSIGTVSMSEAAHTGTTLGDYSSSLACVNAANQTVTVSPNNNTSGTITVVAGDVITCTFTNTNGPQVKLVKTLNPTTDGGKFDFTLAGTSFNNSGSGYGNGGTTGFQSVSIGSVSFSESAHSGTSLTDYVSTLSCVNAANGAVTVSPNNNTSGTISVAAGDRITCTFVNNRKPQVKLVKTLNPTNDPGLFDFTLAGASFTNSGAGYSNNGTTGFQNEAVGSVSFSEAGHGTTALTDYVSTLSCVNAANQTVASNPNGTNTAGSVTVAYGDQITCTFVNNRKPQLKLVKSLVPTTDGGLFDFTLAGTSFDNSGSGYGNGGTTGFQNEATGSVSFSEAAHTGTTLTDYTSALACTNAANATVASNPNGTNTAGSVTLAYGDKITCTFTNTRRPKVKLVKSLNPTTDAGTFDLTLAGTLFNNSGAGYGNGGTTDFQFVSIGTVTMSEAGHTGTSLGSYDSALACVNAANQAVTVSPNNKTSGSISVAAGDVITCTFTNTRRATITINKRENGVLPLIHTWSFEIRSGASTLAAGTLEATGTANTTTGVVTFSCSPEDANCTNVGGVAQLLPGNYQLCETGMPVGYHNNITGFTPLGAAVEGQDNSTECVNITLGIGGSGVPTGVPDPIDNVAPPGGDARTIGYWKNWSSCTGGMQFTKATAPGGVGISFTLDGYLPNSPSVFPIGLITSLTCNQAVLLLGKSDIVTGQKMASDAAYGLAAQLFAAKLNVAAGAGHSACADAAIANGQALLVTINFTGTGSYLGKVSGPTQTALKNNALLYASQLDQYNNNTLPCP